MSCRLQTESLSMAIDDPLTAWLVVEMCSSWTPGFTNPLTRDKPAVLSNQTVRDAHANLPHDALAYVEWTHCSLNCILPDWHRTQFELARDFIRDVAQTQDIITFIYS